MAETSSPPSSDGQFVRPAKSPARRAGGSDGDGGATNGNGDGGGVQAAVVQSATNVYNRAPDLGVGSAVQNAYSRAPDLGVQSTIASVTGFGQQQSTTTMTGSAPQTTSTPSAGAQGQQQQRNGAAASGEEQLSPRQISEREGPSSQDRVGKSQKEIGTEHTIPTAAGFGTTVSPDKSNASALQKSESSTENKPRKAAVPEDYAPEPCPDGTGRKSGGSSGGGGRTSGGRTSGGGGAAPSGSQTPKSNASSNERKRRSFGEKLRDQVRGEMKILAGSMTNNEEKITHGLNIKHGDV